MRDLDRPTPRDRPEPVPVRSTTSSVVAAAPAEVWAAVATLAGVNAELLPWCRMREPRSLQGRTLDS